MTGNIAMENLLVTVAGLAITGITALAIKFPLGYRRLFIAFEFGLSAVAAWALSELWMGFSDFWDLYT